MSECPNAPPVPAFLPFVCPVSVCYQKPHTEMLNKIPFPAVLKKVQAPRAMGDARRRSREFMNGKQQLLSCLVGLLLAGLAPVPISAQPADAAPASRFYLPRSPVAAAYVLSRLSNQELIDAPRSEYVYMALLEREGLHKKYRLEALAGLAKIHQTDPVTELVRGMQRLDAKPNAPAAVLHGLARLLLQSETKELNARQPLLEQLAAKSRQSLPRQIGYAALLTANAQPDGVWEEAAQRGQLADLLLAIPQLRTPELRLPFRPLVAPLVQHVDQPDLQQAAIPALASIPGRETETFQTLATLIQAGQQRDTAINALQQIEKSTWPKSEATPLLESLLAYFETVPPAGRTEDSFVSAVRFAKDLASLLPPDQAQAAQKKIQNLGVSVFVIGTIPEQMLYDTRLIVVQAGKPVQLILENKDFMQHNLVVVQPGAVEEIGTASEKMTPEPDAQGRLYIPPSPQVLYATKMLNTGEKATLTFVAPTRTGAYNYLCTFPGHWRRMTGTLAVVDDVDAYLASHQAEEPKLTEWKTEDFASDLAAGLASRDPVQGRHVFTTSACVQCHKIGPDGYAYGPDLSGVFQRWQGNATNVLTEMLEPSKVIADRYRNHLFETKDGDLLTGLIVAEDDQSLTIQTGPSDALVQKLPKNEIVSRQPQPNSVMPVGLLYPLSKEQILDLLAYLQSGGKLAAQAHHH